MLDFNKKLVFACEEHEVLHFCPAVLTAESYRSLEGPANVQQTISGPLFPMGMDADAGPSSSPPQSNHQVMLLEQEVTSLKTELAQARETIRKLQAQEKELRTRCAIKDSKKKKKKKMRLCCDF